MLKRFYFGFVVAFLLSAVGFLSPTRAQDNLNDLLSMRIEAGYDTFYRPDYWLPVRIRIENRGETIRGNLVVRPATSGSGIEHTYSTPVELSPGEQNLFLYITPRDLAVNVRVELIDENERTIISTDSPLRALLARDSLFVVVSGTLNSRLNLSTLHPTGYNSYQVRWRIANIPDRAEGLIGVNMLIFNDVNTDELNLAQREAIRTWVIGGGHLVMMGGSNWQSTASGLNELLPFSPTNSITASDGTAFLQYAGDYQTTFTTDYPQTEGNPRENSQIIVGTQESPFIIRQTIGDGTVDYVTVNLEAPPFSEWDKLSNIFLGLIASAQTPIGWRFGFSDWDNAQSAVQILPGVDLLPAVLSLVAFLGAYIILIGPVNYLLLRAINRRGFAWITIPIFIIIFTILAWSVGIELRGTDARLNRITVVRTWQNTDEAHINQLIGLLAPRRGNYDLIMNDERTLRPLLTPNEFFELSTPQTNIEIRQTSQFAAVNVPVDASFISAFQTSGIIEKPAITGDATWFYRNGSPLLRGSVRNNTDINLTDAVILARGIVRPIGNVEAGDIVPFETDAPAVVRETAMPASIEFAWTDEMNSLFATDIRSRNISTRSFLNATDFFGQDAFYDGLGSQIVTTMWRNGELDERATQIFNQRRALIASFMIDQYGSRARGNRVFLLGWSETSPTEENMGEQTYSSVDTTLYIIELDVEITPTEDEIIVSKDQFTWLALTESQIGNISPSNLNTSLLDENIVAFRFTPIASAQLEEVTALSILIDRTSTSLNNTLELWDWQAETWVAFQIGGQSRYEVEDYAPFIGAQNAVQIRTTSGLSGGSRYIQQLGIEQRGMMP
ncbi:MAG: hypothetical protein MUE54_00830 [Anaerolineae bacterium]|nr:hypothetical protein [Anaerolineae bacterium]